MAYQAFDLTGKVASGSTETEESGARRAFRREKLNHNK